MVLGLDHVQLACPRGSEEAARLFYGGLLGLEEIEKPEPLRARGGCWFRAGARQLHLGVEEPFRAAAKAHPALLVDDAEALLGRLEAAGVRCAWDEARPGVARFYADDPWGNRLEFVEAVGRSVGEAPPAQEPRTRLLRFEAPVSLLLREMRESGRYRTIVWAGLYPGHVPHARSDVDLYAVSAEELPHHWTMERVGGRRVELTAYPLERWREILSGPYRHAKHHFTFTNGMRLHDPEGLLPELRETAARVLAAWPPASEETIAEMRNGVAIQRDKVEGFREKGMALHLRMYAQGFALLACGLLATARYGHSADAGKSLTRLMDDPDLPSDVKGMLATLLGSVDEGEMAGAALALADRCLELTGGPVDAHHGGIPR